MNTELARKLGAEALGTALLVAAVIGSGIMATRLTDDVAVQLLANAAATGAVLVALILALGPASGAHFNPAVTAAERLLGGMSTTEAGAYAFAQVVGGAAGAVVANLMFDLPAVTLSTTDRSGGHLVFAEVVATFGLVAVILGVVRSGRSHAAPYAVGAYITAGYWFTSSTSFANPAVTVARTLSDTFAGIEVASVAPFVAAQLAGAALAVWVGRALYPDLPEHADEMVVPQDR